MENKNKNKLKYYRYFDVLVCSIIMAVVFVCGVFTLIVVTTVVLLERQFPSYDSILSYMNS